MRTVGLAVGIAIAVGGCAGRAPQLVAVVQAQDRYSDGPAITAEIEANIRKGEGPGFRARPQGRSESCRGRGGFGGLAPALCYGFSGLGQQGSGCVAESPAIPRDLGGAEIRCRRGSASRSGSQALNRSSDRSGRLGNRVWRIAQDSCVKCSHGRRPGAQDAPPQDPRAHGLMKGGLVSRPVSLATHRVESCHFGAAFHQTKRIRRLLFRRRSCRQRSRSSEDFRTLAGPYPRS
jgi:hypothetical protein